MVDATVYLFKDIGMDVTYKFVPDFTSKTAQKQWFMTKPHDTYDCNYNKIQNLLYINGVEWGNCIGYTYALLDNVDDVGNPTIDVGSCCADCHQTIDVKHAFT